VWHGGLLVRTVGL